MKKLVWVLVLFPFVRKKKERQDETEFTAKIDGKTSLGPSSFFFCKERKDRMKLSLLPKLMKKLVWVPVLFPFVKEISFPVPRLMPYYAETGCSRLLIAC
jgi:hypothetical protein